MYKVNYPSPPGEVYQVCLGIISSCEEGKGISRFIVVGKNMTWKKRGSNRNGNFGEENQNLKPNGSEEYQVLGNLIHPWD